MIIKYETTLSWDVPWLNFQGPHEQTHNYVMSGLRQGSIVKNGDQGRVYSLVQHKQGNYI